MEPYVTSETIKQKSKLWLEKILAFNQHKMHIDRGKTALLVIDMQKYFFTDFLFDIKILPKAGILIHQFLPASRVYGATHDHQYKYGND